MALHIFSRPSARFAFRILPLPRFLAERIFTSAMATAYFLDSQRPKGTAYVIGESGLTQAIHAVDYVITEIDPD